MEAANAISADLQMVLGILDPNQLPSGNISGKALAGQQNQVDLSNFHFYDNMTRSIRHTGKIILDLIPKIYDTQRVMRIIGTDGQPSMETINEQKSTDDGVQTVLNDVTVGEYDVVMDTGPGFMSKRQQAVDAMMPLMAKPELFNVAGDLVFRNMDFPGADVIADRLAAMNPLAQIDEKSDVPPQVQMELAQAKKSVQDMQNQMAAMQLAMKQRADIEGVKQQAETQRELMRQTAKAHNSELMAEVRVNDQNTRSITSQNKTEIEAIVQLLLHRMDTSRLTEEIARRNAEQAQYAQFAAQDIDMGQNPLLKTAPMPQQAPAMQGQPMQQPTPTIQQ
jgi:hypothetical protein